MNVCVDCRETVKVPIIRLQGGLTCPHCLGEIITAEEFYLEAIKELNEKGYYIESYNLKFVGYTCKDNTAIIFDECIDSLPNPLPNDCYVKVIGPVEERQISLCYEFVDCETELSVLRNALNFYLWAVKLPEVNTDRYYNMEKTCYINNFGRDPDFI